MFLILPCDVFTNLLRTGKRVASDAESETAAANVSHLAGGAADGFATRINLKNTHGCSAFACSSSKVIHIDDSMGGQTPSVCHKHLVKRMHMLGVVLGLIESNSPGGPNGVEKWRTKYYHLPRQSDSYSCGSLAFNCLVMGLLGDVSPQGLEGDVARVALAFTLCCPEGP